MFLKSLLARNPRFLEAAVALHQAGRIPANAYLLDLDAMTANAGLMSAEAARLGLTVLAMTKQIGRNPPALDALRKGGIDRFVAVDMACARAIHGRGHRLGHLGHLSQVPRHEAAVAARMRPSRAFMRPATGSTRAMKEASIAPRSRPPPPWTGHRAAASPV